MDWREKLKATGLSDEQFTALLKLRGGGPIVFEVGGSMSGEEFVCIVVNSEEESKLIAQWQREELEKAVAEGKSKEEEGEEERPR